MFTAYCGSQFGMWKSFSSSFHVCVLTYLFTREFYFYHSSVILSQIILIWLQISARTNWLVFKPNKMKYDVCIEWNNWKESVHLLPPSNAFLLSALFVQTPSYKNRKNFKCCYLFFSIAKFGHSFEFNAKTIWTLPNLLDRCSILGCYAILVSYWSWF